MSHSSRTTNPFTVIAIHSYSKKTPVRFECNTVCVYPLRKVTQGSHQGVDQLAPIALSVRHLLGILILQSQLIGAWAMITKYDIKNNTKQMTKMIDKSVVTLEIDMI
ncbi:hypothetical protein LOAG_07686 [Loa loa]|uniref:Uncharacterized protein n=1 Tax=Loa loa TaxID=7209 RepID=A0A1S0TWY9_LOALO|nr:hypothetical protein LOAG_07686 [Loa loa]EFO20802.2 hypothetical protein LOAG_07686 [Loa loa]